MKNLLTFTLFILFVSNNLISAIPERISAFLAVDATDELKVGCKNDIAAMQDALQFISESLNLPLDIQVPSTRSLQSQLVRNWAKNLTNTDVAIFYFSGHGCRQRSTVGPWPNITFSKSDEMMISADLISRIKNASPHLAILLFDCCNDHVRLTAKSMMPTNFRRKRPLMGIKNLFIESKGIVIASASLPGKSAYATDDGGDFTQVFLNTLFQEARRQDLTWYSFMQSMQDEYSYNQKSVYEIDLF